MSSVDPLKIPMHAWEGRQVRTLYEFITTGGDRFPKGTLMTVEHTYRGHLSLQAQDGRRITKINRRRVELVKPLTEMPKKLAEWRGAGGAWGSTESYRPVGMTSRSVMRKFAIADDRWTAPRATIEKACAEAGVECRFR